MSDSEKQRDETSEEQKRADLARARRLTLKRPGKKEKRFSEIDGRYIPPPELQKEIDKLVKAKAEAVQKKKGLLTLFKRDSAPLSAEEEKKEKAEKKRQTRQIRELRGMERRAEKNNREAEKTVPDVQEENGQQSFAEETKRSSFLKTVSLLNAESAKPDAYKSLISLPPQKKLPDGVLVGEIAYTRMICWRTEWSLFIVFCVTMRSCCCRCTRPIRKKTALFPPTGLCGCTTWRQCAKSTTLTAL